MLSADNDSSLLCAVKDAPRGETRMFVACY